MTKRPTREIEDIASLLAAVRAQIPETGSPWIDGHLRNAHEVLVAAARQSADRRSGPDGYLRSSWFVPQWIVMGGLAFACAYVGEVVLDLPRWLTVALVIAGQVALSAASVPVMRRFRAWTRRRGLPPGWPRSGSVDEVSDVAVSLLRIRGLVGELAIERLSRFSPQVRSGRAAYWAGRHDFILNCLHHVDVSLAAAQQAWLERVGLST